HPPPSTPFPYTTLFRSLTGAAAMHYTSADEMFLAESAVSPLQKGVVVPLGIDDALFADSAGGAGGPSPYVLALARLDVKKGLDRSEEHTSELQSLAYLV